ncbi:Membrane protein, putative [Paenibacillus sp. P22]|nr:Membrane protein, putative [Paenibacillus sp. P22]
MAARRDAALLHPACRRAHPIRLAACRQRPPDPARHPRQQRNRYDQRGRTCPAGRPPPGESGRAMSILAAAAFIVMTVLVYGGSKLAHRRWRNLILSPLILTPVAIMAILALCRIPYETYNEGGRWLSAMVGPATVALAVPLHKNAALLKKHALEISAGVAAGWMTGTAAALGICRLFHLDRALADSLLLRATTTPIALAVSGMIGGISTLTAVFVLITGILGTVLGPLVIRWTRIRSEVAQGVLMGSSAHTAGAHKAFELGAVPGSIASVSMLLSAFLSLFLIPLVAGFAA